MAEKDWENSGDLPIGMLINDVSRHFHYAVLTEAEKVGSRGGYHHILHHLEHKDGITQLDLAKLSHLKPPTVSVTLKKMETEGLVTRKADVSDLRQVRVYITEKGKEINQLIGEKILEQERILTESLTDEEIEMLKQILIKIRNRQKTYYIKGRKSHETH